MSPEDFAFLIGVIRDRSGLVLSEDKAYLLETRLKPVMQQHELADLESLVCKVRLNAKTPLVEDVVDAMTTNETFFFRDQKPFDQFAGHVLPELIEARQNTKSLRIWCAACSTGQEPYSLAILLKEAGEKLSGWRTEIVATDLSAEAMSKAKVGLYSQFEVQRGLPVQHLVKYFKQVNETWQIDSAIRAMVSFRPLNLLEDFSKLGRFDVIFCRNVLIYFDRETKSQVLDRMRMIVADDGFLCLGGSETVLGITDNFKNIKGLRGLYGPASLQPVPA